MLIQRYYDSNSMSGTGFSLYFIPKSCRSISFICFFLCLSTYCWYCSKPNDNPRLNVQCRKISQGWNSVAHLLSALEQLYSCFYLTIDVSKIRSCGCWWQKPICDSTAINEKQKIMASAYAAEIYSKIHRRVEGRGRDKSFYVSYLCMQVQRIQKVANTTALKVCILRNVCASLR